MIRDTRKEKSIHYTLGFFMLMILLSSLVIAFEISSNLPVRATCLVNSVTNEYKPGFLTQPERNKVIFNVSLVPPKSATALFVAYRRLSNESRDNVIDFFSSGSTYPCRIAYQPLRIMSLDDVRDCTESPSEPGKVFCVRKEFSKSMEYLQLGIVLLSFVVLISTLSMTCRLLYYVYFKPFVKEKIDDEDSDDEQGDSA